MFNKRIFQIISFVYSLLFSVGINQFIWILTDRATILASLKSNQLLLSNLQNFCFCKNVEQCRMEVTHNETRTHSWRLQIQLTNTSSYESGTQWESNSLVKACYSSLLTITLPQVPKKLLWSNLLKFCVNVAQGRMNETWTHSRSFLLRCCSRPYELGTERDLSSLVKVW